MARTKATIEESESAKAPRKTIRATVSRKTVSALSPVGVDAAKPKKVRAPRKPKEPRPNPEGLSAELLSILTDPDENGKRKYVWKSMQFEYYTPCMCPEDCCECVTKDDLKSRYRDSA